MNVKLIWTDRNTNETGHRIYRSSTPMDTQSLPPPVAELGPDITEWEDTDTPVDQVAYYIVSAVRGAVEAFSDEVMIDTSQSLPELVMASNPFIYWRLNDIGPSVADSSGNGNSGQSAGSVVFGEPGQG